MTDELATGTTPCIATRNVVLQTLRGYIESLDDRDIDRLFLNGTVWISVEDVSTSDVNYRSLMLLGAFHDGVTRQAARGYACILNMDGMPETGLLESELEGLDDPESSGLPVLTTTQAKQMILELIAVEVDSTYDSLLELIYQAQEI